MRLIVGLGNPGQAFAHNRHNIGFMCVNSFARAHGLPLAHRMARSRVALGSVGGVALALAKPRTFMNLSGQAVGPLVRRFQVSLAHLLVIHDDLDLPLGRIRLRRGGGSAGHKGIESIIDALGSQDFPRIRVGIGRPEVRDREQTLSYVLSDFAPAERDIVGETVARVGEAILCILNEGIQAAMNRYNREPGVASAESEMV